MTVEELKSYLQYILPHHFLSRTVAQLANCKIPYIKNRLIKLFISAYDIDLSAAASADPNDYPTFNDFFIRALHKEARPIVDDPLAIASPADGVISHSGEIKRGTLFQAKGKTFTLTELLVDEREARSFEGGNYATVYLAPQDYHRVHMPLQGKLLKTIYVPGRLFSVNHSSARSIPNLFCINERLICLFETELGVMALIMVGAMLVAGIETVWGQCETPCDSKKIIEKNYQDKNIVLSKGSEMGLFKFGSTVILLFPPKKMHFLPFAEHQRILMGALIGQINQKV